MVLQAVCLRRQGLLSARSKLRRLMGENPKIDPVAAMPRVYMVQADDHLNAIGHLIEVCTHYSMLDDAAGFYVAAEKLLEHARELSKIQKNLRLSFNVPNRGAK